ncbi:alpha-L-rhamnosidase [Actinocrispum wychmicini]|uniref:alpha-L-rhamnosidase n=1 Tax=Actinocrispum wychmicini TaxID=1213861 RepID=A0A4R2JA93_9PSEU|nr:alpha-L-rhamnosidase [Actinocrispum wychmicini]
MFGHRRPVRVAILLLLSLVVSTVMSVPASAATGLTVGDLQVDYRTNPLGIDDPHPSLSWRLRSDVRGDSQTAYQALVASRPDLLDHPDIWDSGKVADRTSVAVPYGGPNLRSGTRYYWTVRAWDASGRPSTLAAPAWWETGLLGAADWAGAQWITPDMGTKYTWQDSTLDVDFTIKAAAASVLFRALDSQNFYMWQINTVTTPGKVVLRPHSRVRGTFEPLDEVDLSPVLTPANATAPHHLRIEAWGDRFTTWIDGTQVDVRTDDALTTGTVGFRSSVSEGVPEDARYDNLTVRDLAGQTLFSDDFSHSPDPRFPGVPITDGQLAPDGDPTLLDQGTPPSPLLRHEFVLDKPVAKARAYAYGLGFYDLHLNGGKVGDHVLAPAATSFDQRNLYDTYDVTEQLHQGPNAVGIWLGTGYGPRFSQYGFRWPGPDQAILLLTVTFTDGTQRTVSTDDSWRWSAGPITADDIYDGETYDARLQQDSWDKPGFNESAWHPVRTTAAPSPVLASSDLPPIRVAQTLRATKLTQPQPGMYVYDFGQNIAGWERLSVAGPAGATVRMRTAEELRADGTLDTTTNRNAASNDTYILSAATGPQTYEPRFTYHGFRYLEVTGYPGTPTLDSVVGVVAHADVTSTGTIETSDPLLNRIWQNNRWAVLNNSMSLPTDTPVRDERTPPGMDVQAYHDAAVLEFGMDRFYGKYLLDMPPPTAPPNDPDNAPQPDMDGGAVTLVWSLYEQYGDLPTLARTYPGMKDYVDSNAAAHPSLIWPDDRGFGDWCPPDHSPNANGGQGNPDAGSCFSERSLVNTALFYLQATDTAKAATALNHPDEAMHFTQLAAKVAHAFNAHFLDATGTTYGSGRQVTSVLPLAFGMVPADKMPGVGAHLVDTILTRDNGHLDTGIFGTRYLVDALARIGRMDVAKKILGQTSYPGFGYEVQRGATTPWEQWTYESTMETHDHAMFAGINTSLYTQLAGITPASPGYAAISVAPQVPRWMERVSASIDTVRGTVTSSWTLQPCTFDLSVTVPVNAVATVSVPVARLDSKVDVTPGTVLLSGDATTRRYSVGSGSWQFTSQLCGWVHLPRHTN